MLLLSILMTIGAIGLLSGMVVSLVWFFLQPVEFLLALLELCLTGAPSQTS